VKRSVFALIASTVFVACVCRGVARQGAKAVPAEESQRPTATHACPTLAAAKTLSDWGKLLNKGDADLVKSLASDNVIDRLLARHELARRLRVDPKAADKARAGLLQLLNDVNQPAPVRIAALLVVRAAWNDEVALALIGLLAAGDPDLRRLAAETLGLKAKVGDRDVHEALVHQLNDEDRAVRRAVMLAMGTVHAPGAAEALVSALRADDGSDKLVHDCIVQAIERTGKDGIDKLMALLDSGVARDRDHVVRAFQALRSRAAAEALPEVLRSYHLTSGQKASVLLCYRNYRLEPPLSLEPVLDYLASLPEVMPGQLAPAKKVEEMKALAPIKLAGLEVLSARGALRGQKAQRFVLGLLTDLDPGVRLAAIRAIEDACMTPALPRLRQLLNDRDRSVEEHEAAQKALRTLTAAPK
jgi:HEAT repeat protein